MSNHYHLVRRPLVDGDMSRFMGWLGGTHTMRYHAHDHTSGMRPYTNSATRAFRFRRTTTFSSSVGMWSATHCVLDWLIVPKRGDGVRCGDGCQSVNRIRSSFQPGRFLGCQSGCNASTNHLPKPSWMPFEFAHSAGVPWETKAGWNRSSGDSSWRRQCVLAADHVCDHRKELQSKRPDPFFALRVALRRFQCVN